MQQVILPNNLIQLSKFKLKVQHAQNFQVRNISDGNSKGIHLFPLASAVVWKIVMSE